MENISKIHSSKISEHLFSDLNNKFEIIQKIRNMPLSAKTVKDRTNYMVANIPSQQIKDINSTPAYLITCDGSRDVQDIEQIAVLCRCVNSAGPQVEILDLVLLKGQTQGEDI